MQLKLGSFSLVVLALLVLAVAAPSLNAQTAGDQGSNTQTVTGCLQKGNETGGYYIIGANDKHWELYSNGSAPLADNVGHTITVTGTVATRTPEQEQKSQPSEKKETGKRAHSDLQVSDLQVVSADCKK
jgi:hypothetical protein